jgi:putative oxidoreductase
MPNSILALLDRLRAFGDRLSPLGPLLARLTVGIVFVGSGWGKLTNFSDTVENFTKWQIPMPSFNAGLASATEFVGGILMILGLGTRLVALPMSFTMVVAIIAARREAIDGIFSFFGLDEWAYIVVFLWLACAGAGPLSVDGLLGRRRHQKTMPAAPARTPLHAE